MNKTQHNGKTSVSCQLFQGNIRHRRFTPTGHELNYQTRMILLDLEHLPEQLNCWPLSAYNKPAITSFKRKDYCGDGDLRHYILQQVQQQIGLKLTGRVLLLTNLRHWGILMNPISMFYCFDQQDQLCATVLQVTNTPWGERILYVLATQPEQKKHYATFTKQMHVSPFNPMDMHYRCRFNQPGKHILFHIENTIDDSKHTDATLVLRQHQILSSRSLAWFYLRRIPEPLKTLWRIYSHAFRLWLKKTPFYDHQPKSSQPTTEH